MKSILIGGLYGYHNIGDEAILDSIINTFRYNYNVTVTTESSEWIESKYDGISRVKLPDRFVKPKFGIPYYRRPLRLLPYRIFKTMFPDLTLYANADIYICGGGTSLSDCPWHTLKTAQLAGKAGIPVYLWGAGMAEVRDADTLQYIKKVLGESYIKKIFVRDSFVKERLLKIGVAENKICVSYDPAVMTEGHSFDMRKYMTDVQIALYEDKRKNIVVTISGESDVIGKTPLDTIADAVSEIQEKEDANIFLIPTGCGKHCKDRELLHFISKKLKNRRTVLIDKEFNPEELVHFLKKIDLIISSRLHMNILGACVGTPSIGLVRNEKISDFAKLMKMPCLSLETLKSEQITGCAKTILCDEDGMRNRICKKTEQMKAEYRKAVGIMMDELIKT